MSLARRARAAREGLRLALAVLRERAETGAVFNPLAERHRRDPYPLYRRLRERDPVHRSRPARGWVCLRHADCAALLRDARLSADDRNFQGYAAQRAQAIRDGLADPDEEPARTMLRSDPPDHTRLRGLVSKAFTARAVEKLRPRVERVTEELLDHAARARGFDAIRDLAVPLPVTIIAEMLGIPARDRKVFKRWSDHLVGFLDPQASPGPRALRRTVEEFREYVGRIAAARREKPADDLLSALVLAEEAGDRLSEEELFGTVALLLAAGNETTTNLIGNGLLALLRHPGAWEALRDEPERASAAVEEALRYDSPVQLTARIPTEEVDLRGHRLEPGQAVLLVLGAANRDPEVFPEPDRFDLERSEGRHLAFGLGRHFCLGAPLARLEAGVAFAELARRLPDLRLGTEPERLRWRRLSFLRGLEALPLEVGRPQA